MLIPDGCAQINWRFTGDAAPTGAEVTLGVAVDTFTGSVADAAASAHSAWSLTALVIQSESITLDSTLVKFGPNATGPSAVYAVPFDGSADPQADVPNTSVLVRKVTAFGGRTGSGRMFVPGYGEGLWEPNGTMTLLNLSGIQDSFDDLWTALTADNLVPVLLHGEDSPVTTPLPITSFQVQQLAATQRRRLRR